MENIENHMVAIKDTRTEEDELTIFEIKSKFKDWYLNVADSDEYIFELFHDNWSHLEFMSWARNGTTWKEFEKYKVEYLVKEFNEDTGLSVTEEIVKTEI